MFSPSQYLQRNEKIEIRWYLVSIYSMIKKLCKNFSITGHSQMCEINFFIVVLVYIYKDFSLIINNSFIYEHFSPYLSPEIGKDSPLLLPERQYSWLYPRSSGLHEAQVRVCKTRDRDHRSIQRLKSKSWEIHELMQSRYQAHLRYRWDSPW